MYTQYSASCVYVEKWQKREMCKKVASRISEFMTLDGQIGTDLSEGFCLYGERANKFRKKALKSVKLNYL